MVKKRLSKSSLLWFVRSRSYVTIADVRRRFGINGSDEVSPIEGPLGQVFVGLPSKQARLLEELWREGKVGLELAADVRAPTVTGVYGVYQPRESAEPQPTGEEGEVAVAPGVATEND